MKSKKKIFGQARSIKFQDNFLLPKKKKFQENFKQISLIEIQIMTDSLKTSPITLNFAWPSFLL